VSKQNKVNKTNYVQGGRLTPDDLARERMKQGEQSRAKAPPTRPRFGEAGKKDVIEKVRSSSVQESSRPQTAREEEE
jgi:hypothetical protein